MNLAPEKTLSKFERVIDVWLTDLASFTDEEFSRAPSEASWSIGQVYAHLIGSARHYHMSEIAKCLDPTKSTPRGKKSFRARLAYLIGGIPPIRVRVPPSPHYTPKQPESKDAVRLGLEDVRLRMRELAKEKALSTAIGTTAHPAFGYLSGAEWYALIEMHYRHHLRQKRRLEDFLHSR